MEDLPADGPLLTPGEAWTELLEESRWDLRIYRLAAHHPRVEARLRAVNGRRIAGLTEKLLADPAPEVRAAIAAALEADARPVELYDLPGPALAYVLRADAEAARSGVS
jgi:hypothetical protein